MNKSSTLINLQMNTIHTNNTHDLLFIFLFNVVIFLFFSIEQSYICLLPLFLFSFSLRPIYYTLRNCSHIVILVWILSPSFRNEPSWSMSPLPLHDEYLKSEYKQHYNGYNLLWLSVEEVIRLARQVHWEERLQQLKCNYHLE